MGFLRSGNFKMVRYGPGCERVVNNRAGWNLRQESRILETVLQGLKEDGKIQTVK